jgi:hypothetical protein
MMQYIDSHYNSASGILVRHVTRVNHFVSPILFADIRFYKTWKVLRKSTATGTKLYASAFNAWQVTLNSYSPFFIQALQCRAIQQLGSVAID